MDHELRQFFLRHDLIDFSFKEAKGIVTKADKSSGMVIMGADSYDIVAGTLIVQESRGIINNLNKESWEFGQPYLFAGSKKAWTEVSKLINL